MIKINFRENQVQNNCHNIINLLEKVLCISNSQFHKQLIIFTKSFCVCVKYITLCNCLYSSPFPSHSSLVLSGILGNLEEKTILQTTKQLIQFTVLEIHFQSLEYMAVIRIRKTLSNIPFHTSKRWLQDENSVDVNNPLQTVLKHLRLYILTQIV